MEVELNSKERAFLRRMVDDGPELKRIGFELLQARQKPERYFGALLKLGLFAPTENPAPEKVGRGWRFENWPAILYLKALAQRVAGDYPTLKDVGQEIVGIIRAFDAAPSAAEGPSKNFFTQMASVEIFTALPQALTTPTDAAMVARWLDNTRGLAADVCEWLNGLIDKPSEVEKAIVLLKALTAPREEDNSDTDTYWIKELLTKRAGEIGQHLGRPALQLLRARLEEIVNNADDPLGSLYARPAIEEHEQNRYRPELVGALVVGLRDGLHRWIDLNAGAAQEFVNALLHGDAPIVRRVALNCIDERFDKLGALFVANINQALFQITHRHELHRLLSRHFAKLKPDEQNKILGIIGAITVDMDEGDRYSRYERARWLSACVGQGVAAAEELMTKTLNMDPAIKVPAHPDFDTYSESWSGSGPSPYTTQQILGWSGTELTENLRSFVERDPWRGPTRRSLSDTLADAIRQKPEQFLRIAKHLDELPWTYRYSVLNAFNDLAQKENASPTADQPWWAEAWEMLIGLMERWIHDPELLQEVGGGEITMTPTQAWIPGVIARLIEEGAKKDDRGLLGGHIDRARSILTHLLAILPPEEKPRWKDALQFAINTPRGRLLEALIRLTLKDARAQDKTETNHNRAWAAIQPVLDRELQNAKDSNFEFSALAGLYLPQLHHLSAPWLELHLKRLLPVQQFRKNAEAFLNGMAYGQMYRPLYQLLAGAGLVTEILGALPDEKQSKERFIHAVALAYLWGDEKLDGAHIRMLMAPGREADLTEFLDFFRRVIGQLDEPQKQLVRDLVLPLQNAQGDCRTTPPALLSVLVGLTPYLDKLGDGQRKFLVSALPLLEDGHYIFLTKELNRLLESNPAGVAEIAREVVRRQHFHDYQDELKKLIRALHAKGLIEESLGLCDELHMEPAFRALFAELGGRH